MYAEIWSIHNKVDKEIFGGCKCGRSAGEGARQGDNSKGGYSDHRGKPRKYKPFTRNTC